MKLPTHIIDEYGVIHALDARGLYVPYTPPEPKSATWMYYWVAGAVIAAVVAWGWLG